MLERKKYPQYSQPVYYWQKTLQAMFFSVRAAFSTFSVDVSMAANVPAYLILGNRHD